MNKLNEQQAYFLTWIGNHEKYKHDTVVRYDESFNMVATVESFLKDLQQKIRERHEKEEAHYTESEAKTLNDIRNKYMDEYRNQ